VNPPAWARVFLAAVAGQGHTELVAGDLHEEFLCLCRQHGRRAGNRWYARQVVRSAPALLQLRMRSGELTQVLAAAVLGVAMPLLLLDRLWCFVYSQIPLKDGLDRAPAILAANAAVVCLCAALAGLAVRRAARALAMAAAATAAAGFGLWGSAGSVPVLYLCAVLLGAPASSLLVFVMRRDR
jgi:hypothetical protein